MLKVQNYLRSGKSLASLAGAPYNLIIKEEGNLVMLRYNQLASDFSEAIVQECRGIILYKKTWDVVCWPFSKFFNYGEPYAAILNESKLYVYQKIDGSLTKVWYFEGRWHLSSNGVIDAAEAMVGEDINLSSLFLKTLSRYNLDWESFTSTLDKEYTYMYELATPDNKVVVPYKDYNLFYLGQRHNRTGQEAYCPDDRISNVGVYTFQTIDDIINSANQLPDSEEGYVVRDQNWNRVKIKNPIYFMLHKIANNGKPDILQYVLERNEDELLAYFPEYRHDVDVMKGKLCMLEIVPICMRTKWPAIMSCPVRISPSAYSVAEFRFIISLTSLRPMKIMLILGANTLRIGIFTTGSVSLNAQKEIYHDY